MRVISADCHINEPPHVFDGVPEKLKAKAPKMMPGVDGGDWWSFDGKPPQRTFGIEATAGQKSGIKKMSGLKFSEILPGNYDGAAHVKDMDLDGVDVSVVYPNATIFVYVESDRELAVACMRSYNDWILDEFQAANPKRLIGLPLLPVDDGMDVCVAEFERCLAKGARGFFIPGFPVNPYHGSYYDPLYARASEADVSLNFHRTFGGRPAESDYDEVLQQKITTAGTVYRFFSAVRPFTYLAMSDAFVKHPNLKIVGAEVNFGWIPFWAQTMEQNFDVRSAFKDDTIKTVLRPTEYLGRNLFVTVLDDYVGFRLMADYPYLADAAMFSTDYPHSVCLWPDTREHIKKLAVGADAAQIDNVLAGNAARLYRI